MSLLGSIASIAAPTFMASLGAASSFFGPSDERMANRSYNRQMQDSISMWNMQNDYNSPKEQVKRFIEAGLNPAMMYERGSVDNTAGSLNLPSYPQVRGSNQNRDRLFEMATKFFLNKSMENAEDQSRENALNEEYLGLRNDILREKLNQLKNGKKSGISEDSSSSSTVLSPKDIEKAVDEMNGKISPTDIKNVKGIQNMARAVIENGMYYPVLGLAELFHNPYNKPELRSVFNIPSRSERKSIRERRLQRVNFGFAPY